MTASAAVVPAPAAAAASFVCAPVLAARPLASAASPIGACVVCPPLGGGVGQVGLGRLLGHLPPLSGIAPWALPTAAVDVHTAVTAAGGGADWQRHGSGLGSWSMTS
eukprot:TRINITY_DN18248_c0_g1_i1.p6 TRINITY_DN18248_c0_g1~~TRINITY_DN18248_c0_g1_i1.p6  ORF type:complete len:107 (+),score=25.21 TRINITY_DN18248_c0_g1_i1:190-510(+)